MLLTLLMLSTWMNRDGTCYTGQKKLADGARVDVRTLRRHLIKAEQLGWLGICEGSVGGKGWRVQIYRCAVPAHIELSEVDEEISDAITAQEGEINTAPRVSHRPERPDIQMSAPSPQRADTQMSAPQHRNASPLPATCGHSARRGADKSEHRADIQPHGADMVRTSTPPVSDADQVVSKHKSLNSQSITPKGSMSEEAQAEARALSKNILPERDSEAHRQVYELRIRKIRTALQTFPDEAHDDQRIADLSGTTPKEVRQVRASA